MGDLCRDFGLYYLFRDLNFTSGNDNMMKM